MASNSGSPEIADRLIDSITGRFVLLAGHPNLGRPRDQDLRSGLRSFAVGNYIIIYRIEDGDVLILRLLRGNRNIEAVLGRRVPGELQAPASYLHESPPRRVIIDGKGGNMTESPRLSTLPLAAVFALLARHPGPALAQTVLRSVALDPPLEIGTKVNSIGTWSGGALLVLEGELDLAPVMRIYDASGTEAQRIDLQVPGAEGLDVLHRRIARSSSGYVAFAGTAYSNNGRAGGFLATVSPDGTSQRVVRTEPYVPFAVTFAPDGTIWTAGLKKDDSGRDAGDSASYFVIQRFDTQGRQLRGAVPRSTFPGPVTPVDTSFFVTSKDRVAWVSPLAHRYMEFSLDGKLLASYPFAFSYTDLNGGALCDDETLWMSLRVRPGPAGQQQSALASFDRATGTWHKGTTQPFIYLYGCSENKLITSPASWRSLNWLAEK